LAVIIQNFHLVSFDNLQKLSNLHLLKIFSSELFQIENEDHFFQLIRKMIDEDKNRKVLLKTVHFEFVSSHFLKKFFENIPIDEIDFELFESLKKRLFSDYSGQKQFANRWRTKPKILSETEASDILELLQSYFEEERNPLKQIKSLIEQIKQLKKDNESLQKRNQQFEKENNQKSEEIIQLKAELETFKEILLKGKTIRYQNDHSGIFQDLKKTGSNTFSLTCSSVYGNDARYNQEKALIYDTSTYFLSENHSNSWISVQLISKKVSLEGYLLRSSTNKWGYNPKNWKLEASNDNVSWVQLDQQINRNWVNPDWTEVYFPVSSKESFSYFKFTQTGKNYDNCDYFLVPYLEFFETILDQQIFKKCNIFQ
jgi:hypothetical protein